MNRCTTSHIVTIEGDIIFINPVSYSKPTVRIGDKFVDLKKAGEVDILNVKCNPIMMGSLRGKPGFCPAYHMNKDKWITILLDGSAGQEDIKALLAMSYTMTAMKIRRRNHVQADETV